MRSRLAAIVVCIGLSSAAYAAEWSMNTTLRETIETSDNPFMRGVPAEAIGSYSSISNRITGRTKTSRFDFDGDFTYRKYWGPGAQGTTLGETTDNGVRLHYETFGKVPADRNYIDASWRRRDAALAILDDFGLPSNVTGDIHTTTVMGGIERGLTPTDVWTWSSRASSTDYIPASGGTQYYDVATTSTYRRQVNRTTAFTTNSEFEWLKYDNSTQTNIMIIRYMAGFHLQPFRNVDFLGSAGAATVVVEQGDVPPVTNPFATAPSDNVSTAFVGTGRLIYRPFKTTELTLTASQTVGPNVIGALTQRQSAGASLRYTVNDRARLTTQVDLTRQIITNAQTDFISASTTYSQTLARDWNLDLTYRYQHRSATSGTASIIFDPITGVPILLNGTNTDSASSNSFLFSLSRKFIVLPKRTPG